MEISDFRLVEAAAKHKAFSSGVRLNAHSSRKKMVLLQQQNQEQKIFFL